ncbi:glutamate ABC transporter substrate-binding protein [Streptomyces sp. WAC06614]|uniref:glutamate ABC transporter substrate-binding protein n=1 Tax=Streptomyces sp. WAC06614 TaxID=2487416 RepID=UPI000F79B8DC|nr:glutamate ABC transporter substrate-binding protein [Streptomyces sp. WAC06614]RSS70751.1 glutamate ABC transporter substrate-binding protein [Streptomyces sp. WAC06614]
MKLPKAGAVAGVIVLALTASGCGAGEEAKQQKIAIGIKFDQPGLGLREDGKFTGFDVDVATYVAKELGYKPEQIEFKQVYSSDRELMIQFNEVKFVVASYSINDKRKAKVDFAGPYFVAHQDLLIRSNENEITKAEDLNKKRLCSVTGSTSAENVKAKVAPKAELQELGGYSECLVALQDTTLDALTTDNSILAGYAAQPQNVGKFKLANLNLSNEFYGIGLKKGDKDLQKKINDALRKMVKDGSWDKFVQQNFGAAQTAAQYRHEPAPQITEGR